MHTGDLGQELTSVAHRHSVPLGAELCAQVIEAGRPGRVGDLVVAVGKVLRGCGLRDRPHLGASPVVCGTKGQGSAGGAGLCCKVVGATCSAVLYCDCVPCTSQCTSCTISLAAHNECMKWQVCHKRQVTSSNGREDPLLPARAVILHTARERSLPLLTRLTSGSGLRWLLVEARYVECVPERCSTRGSQGASLTWLYRSTRVPGQPAQLRYWLQTPIRVGAVTSYVLGNGANGR